MNGTRSAARMPSTAEARAHARVLDGAAQDHVAEAHEPEEEREREARVPRPPGAPHGLAPQRPGHEHDGREDEPHLGRALRDAVELLVLEPEVERAGDG